MTCESLGVTDEPPSKMKKKKWSDRYQGWTLRPYAELATKIASIAPTPTGRRLVAVDECGGSGKSTFAQCLTEELVRAGFHTVTVPVDDFYRPPGSEGPEPEGLFDLTRLKREVIDPYLSGKPVSYRPFDWERGRISRDTRHVGSPSVLVLEGVFATSPLLGGQHSFSVWVAAPRALRLSRGVERDGEAWRKTWTEVWMPREDSYFERTRPDWRADLVVDAGWPSSPGAFWCNQARNI
jgi:uridine kinase